jgi:hypothetical protein
MGRSEGPQVERKRDGVLARILSSNAIWYFLILNFNFYYHTVSTTLKLFFL